MIRRIVWLRFVGASPERRVRSLEADGTRIRSSAITSSAEASQLETSLNAGHLAASYHTGDWPESLGLGIAGLQDEQPSTVRGLLLQSSMRIRLSLGADMADDQEQVRTILGRMGDDVSRSGILDMAAPDAPYGGRLEEARLTRMDAALAAVRATSATTV